MPIKKQFLAIVTFFQLHIQKPPKNLTKTPSKNPTKIFYERIRIIRWK
jgi:hypothetical protein